MFLEDKISGVESQSPSTANCCSTLAGSDELTTTSGATSEKAKGGLPSLRMLPSDRDLTKNDLKRWGKKRRVFSYVIGVSYMAIR